MIIKYYYQIGFLYDKTNPMIIILGNQQQQFFSKDNILNFLAVDGVDISKVESIRYKNKLYSGWIECSDKRPIQILNEDNELELLLIIKEKPIVNVDFQQVLDQLLKKISIQEKKITEFENRFNKYYPNNISVHHGSMSTPHFGYETQTSLDLQKFNSYHVSKDYLYEESRLDFSFLYSNPLVKDIRNKKDIPMNEPIDFEREINCLVDILKGSEKKISSRFDVATHENIGLVLGRRPKIIHISCHGAYEEVDGISKFFLYFEDDKGKLEKFDTEKLKTILNHTGKAQVEVVFVSACYSEPIAQVFKDAGVPAVICVHSATKVLDQAAQEFAKNFYKNLLDGLSLKSAFEMAKQVVLYRYDKNKHKTLHCCCLHNHTDECRWKNLEDDAHTQHLKTCVCNYEESHMHRRNCLWAKKILSLSYISENVINNESLIKVCCCSPSIAHDESKKFILKIDDNYDPIIFHNLIQGNLEIKNKNCCLNVNFSVDMKTSLIGRNVELYKVFNIFCNLNKNRMVTVYGKSGVGKNSFCKLAGRYMYERNCFPDGIFYINNKGKSFNESWFISKISTCLELNTHNHELISFCKKISILRMLIIINFSYTAEEIIDEIRNVLKFVLENTKYPKFLISSRKTIDIEMYENKLNLEVLNNYYSSRLLYALAGEYLPAILKNDFEELEKHEVIKLTQGNPERIHQIAGLLQENKKFENLLLMLKNENRRKENLTNDLLKLSLDKMGQKTTYVEEILYLLYILPDGILESEIGYLFPDYKEVVNVLDELSNSVIVTKSENKNLSKQIVYNLSIELMSCIDSQLQIREEIKKKVYKNIICFYSNLCRNLVIELYNSNDNIEKATEFSAAQNQGLWLTFNKIIYERIFQKIPIKHASKRFDFSENNIFSLLKIDKIINLLINNDEELMEAIEQLTICLPTIYKLLNKMNDCVNQYKLLLKITNEYNLELAEARLYLFKVSLYPILFSNSIMQYVITIQNDIVKAKKIFEKKNLLEGEAEACFVEGVTTYEININSNRNGFERISVDSFKEIHKILEKSIEKYRRVSEIGMARACFVLAEYNVANRHYEETVYRLYEEALQLFEIHNKHVLKIKCLLGISKWYLGIFNEVKSMEYVKFAKDFVDSNKDLSHIIAFEVKEMMSDLLEYIRTKKLYNVFVFIKAHQLVKKAINENELLFQRSKSIELSSATTIKDLEVAVEPVINHYSNFRDKITEIFKKAKKEIQLKFDYLTENSFLEILRHTGRVLHISSDEYSENGSLYVEGEDGESNEICQDKLLEILNTSNCPYELVIIAMPKGKTLGQIFLNSRVKNVICFDIDEQFIKYAEVLPNFSFYNILHEFSISFLNHLINENTLQNAFQLSLKEFYNQIELVRQEIIKYNLKKDPLNMKAYADILLLPENANNNIKLFGDLLTQETQLFDGQILDLSKRRSGLYGVNKRDSAFIGRKKELFELIKIMKYSHISNLYGEPGCGKTFIVKEACYYLHTRNYFKDGIFYFDIDDIKNIAKIKNLFSESSLNSFIEENMKINKDDKRLLVVFDNSDKIIKYADNQLFVFLDSMNKDRNIIHYLFVTHKKITNSNIIDHIEITKLKEKESQLIFMHYLNRYLNEDEIDIDKNYYDEKNDFIYSNILDLVGYSSCLKKCNGKPKYIKMLSEVAAAKNSLKNIREEDFLPRKFSKNTDLVLKESEIPSKAKTAIGYKILNKSLLHKSSIKTGIPVIENKNSINDKHKENKDNKNNIIKNISFSAIIQNQNNLNNSTNSQNNSYFTKKSINTSEDYSNIIISNDIRHSFNSNISNSSINTINISTKKRRSRKNRSEIKELSENEDNKADTFSSEKELSEDLDPMISKQIKGLNASINKKNDKNNSKNEDESFNPHGQIIIQNIFNNSNSMNNFDYNYIRGSSNNSRDSFISQNDNNPFKRYIDNNLPFTRMKNPLNYNSLPIMEINDHLISRKSANIEKYNSSESKKKKIKNSIKSGKMHKKYTKKKKDKYFKNQEEIN